MSSWTTVYYSTRPIFPSLYLHVLLSLSARATEPVTLFQPFPYPISLWSLSACPIELLCYALSHFAQPSRPYITNISICTSSWATVYYTPFLFHVLVWYYLSLSLCTSSWTTILCPVTLFHPSPVGARGFKSRMCPPYPHACRKRRLKWGAVI